MSAGGVFKLIISDSSVDDLMMRTAQLTNLISQIEAARVAKAKAAAKANGKPYVEEDQHESYVPTIAEISNHFTVPIYSFFKPFVACAMEYVKHKARSNARFGSTVSFTLNQLGLFITDVVAHVRTTSFAASSTGGTYGVRWAAFPAHRAFAHTTLRINNNSIDEYYSEDYNAHFQYNVPTRKRNAWMRNVGQQVPYEGVMYPDPVDAEVGQIGYFVDGNQTAKATQPSQDWWVPLLFWFCDPGYCLPNGLFPHGQAEIAIELANVTELVTRVEVVAGASPTNTNPTIQIFDLWVNQVYVVPELHDVFLAKYGYSLIRVFRHQKKELRLSEDAIQLNGLRWPVEKFYFAFQPTENLDNDQNWYKVSVLTEFQVNTAISTTVFAPGVPAAGFNLTTYYSETSPVTSLELRANDIILYPETDPTFYNSAISFQNGNNDDNGPNDRNWYCMNFNIRRSGGIHQGGWQPPSGHVNCSKARELYLHYKSTFISSANPVNLIVSGKALNFLGIDDSAGQLKYST